VGHRGGFRSGAFSPNGRLFFSGSQDTTVLIWDLTGRVAAGRPENKKLSPQELEGMRADLAAADASRAHRALWTLTAAPGQAVPLFRAQLRPVVAADPERVARLLADLDSDAFAVRDKATRELQEMGEAALPALRKALDGRPPLERRRRAEQLLERLAGWSPEQLYGLRAVEVLEQVGSPEARRLLRALAEGLPEARLTREAKASLQRLAHRPGAAP
jgi:HEAT repeat protein